MAIGGLCSGCWLHFETIGVAETLPGAVWVGSIPFIKGRENEREREGGREGEG